MYLSLPQSFSVFDGEAERGGEGEHWVFWESRGDLENKNLLWELAKLNGNLHQVSVRLTSQGWGLKQVHPKMNILMIRVIPNMYDFLSEELKRCFEELTTAVPIHFYFMPMQVNEYRSCSITNIL